MLFGARGFVLIFTGANCVEGCLSVLSLEQLDKINKIRMLMYFIGYTLREISLCLNLYFNIFEVNEISFY